MYHWPRWLSTGSNSVLTGLVATHQRMLVAACRVDGPRREVSSGVRLRRALRLTLSHQFPAQPESEVGGPGGGASQQLAAAGGLEATVQVLGVVVHRVPTQAEPGDDPIPDVADAEPLEFARMSSYWPRGRLVMDACKSETCPLPASQVGISQGAGRVFRKDSFCLHFGGEGSGLATSTRPARSRAFGTVAGPGGDAALR
jgi:hypothetical protein